MIVPPDVQCFDVERGLAKALGCKVETYLCGPDTYKFRIGLRWDLCVDAEQLGRLWNNADAPTALKGTFDDLKPTCLVWKSYNR